MNKFVEFDQYSEDLLLAQYDVSNIISHELMKGEVREDFLVSILGTCSESRPIIVKGTISDGDLDAGQLDFILCRPHAHVRRIGNSAFVEKRDALCVIEIKGNCTGTDLREAAQRAKRIQGIAGEDAPLFGVICYKLDLQEKTVLSRFGHRFDTATRSYFDNASFSGESPTDWHQLDYPELDFFVSLEEDKKIFLRRYQLSPGVHRFFRSVRSPVISEVFGLIRSLWVGAHQTASA